MNPIAKAVLRDVFGSAVPFDQLELANRIAASIEKHATKLATKTVPPAAKSKPGPRSDKQEQFLELMKDGKGATVTEIAAATGVSKQSAWQILRRMRARYTIEQTSDGPADGQFGKPPTRFKIREEALNGQPNA